MDEHIIYEGIIASHDRESYIGQIVIDDCYGIIKEVVEGRKYEADKIFNQDCVIFAGMGDIHIHAREDRTYKHCYKEEYVTVLNAALNGGLVHVAAMPNTKIPLVDNDEFNWHREKIFVLKHPVDLINYVGIGNNTRPIGEPGEHPYKAYFGKSVGDLTFYDEKELEETIKHYEGHDVSFHVEYEPIIQKSIDGLTHSDRRPISAVNYGLELLLPIIEKYKLNAKLCHWSTGGQSFKMIREHRERAKERGLPYTTIEVSPLHLLFDTSMTNEDPSLWTKIQMNPAVQAKNHRMQLIEGLRSGFIDYLATDHAPHTEIEKYSAFKEFEDKYPHMNVIEIANLLKKENKELFESTCCKNSISGAPWLDVYAPVLVHLNKEHKFTHSDIARISAYNPGKFINRYKDNQIFIGKQGLGFGEIKEGFVGSLTVLNFNKKTEITRDKLRTRVKWSPLEGRVFDGGLEAVIINGRDMTNKFVGNE